MPKNDTQKIVIRPKGWGEEALGETFLLVFRSQKSSESCLSVINPFVREAANKKKVVFLVGGPLRPFPPPPLGLSGHRNFFVMLKRKSGFSLSSPGV